MIRYEEPHMEILYLKELDVITASELQIDNPNNTGSSNWSEWW